MSASIATIIKEPWRIVCSERLQPITHFVPDSLYLKCKFRQVMGYPLNLKDPKTFNEKLQWLKLHDRRPEYTIMVDKYLVKDYVASVIGSEYVVPTIGIWDDPDEIDFDTLPNQFAMKCTHNSTIGICICTDKTKLDIEKVKADLREGLSKNFYYGGREWPYKNVKPRIIAERYMVDDKTGELRDYKFFCFDGKVKALFIATNRQNPDEETSFDFFDVEYNHLPILNGHPMAKIPPEKPECFDKMVQLAEQLSQNIPQVRVDFYQVNGNVFFGEMTFSHWSGLMPMEPKEWDERFGEWIRLPGSKQ